MIIIYLINHSTSKLFNQVYGYAIRNRGFLQNAENLRMYFETRKICRDEGGTIVHMFEDWVIAASKKCRYVSVAGNWNTDGARAAERWWFA